MSKLESKHSLEIKHSIKPTVVMALRDFAKLLRADAANLGSDESPRVAGMAQDFEGRAKELDEIADDLE